MFNHKSSITKTNSNRSVQMYEYSEQLDSTPVKVGGGESQQQGQRQRVRNAKDLDRVLEERNPGSHKKQRSKKLMKNATKSVMNLGKSIGKLKRGTRSQRKLRQKQKKRTAGAGGDAGGAGEDTRTTVSSHFDIQNSDSVTKELMELAAENSKLQEELTKAKMDLQKQEGEFQSERNDLERQIQELKNQLQQQGSSGREEGTVVEIPAERRSSGNRIDFTGRVTPVAEEDSDGDSGIFAPSAQPQPLQRYVTDTQVTKLKEIEARIGRTMRMKKSRSDPYLVSTRAISNGFDTSNGLVGQRGEIKDKGKMFKWAKTFRRADPRFQILSFFEDICQEGAERIDEEFDPTTTSPLIRMFNKAAVFTVWRPTSLDAIRRMMLGEGVGKGLDIKGKSAKKGKLSGYVPFLQIYQEEHKKQVSTHPKDGRIKVFFKTRKARDEVVQKLDEVAIDMVDTLKLANDIVAKQKADEDTIEWAMKKLIWDMTDTTIYTLDEHAPQSYGMNVPERLFWEGMIMRQDISRVPGSENDTGRQSYPSFQNMNNYSLRKVPKDGGPKCVILQYGDTDPMDPLNLVMAYEENGRVMPVVSDFDCFLVGTRGVRYEEPPPEDQIEILRWSINQIQNILDNDTGGSWTTRWLDIKKIEASKGFDPVVPALGFSDPKSINIMNHAINRLRKEGAVRHGSECFNYTFPQELDDEFLVISNDLPGSLQWAYVDQVGLQEILSNKIDSGYTFPLNPKWILCDKGWKAIYDKLLSSSHRNVQSSLDSWFPPDIRSQIESIHQRHPDGFQVDEDQLASGEEKEEHDGTAAMDLAEQELRAYMTFQRAKRKLRGIFMWRSLLSEMRKRRERQSRADNVYSDAAVKIFAQSERRLSISQRSNLSE